MPKAGWGMQNADRIKRLESLKNRSQFWPLVGPAVSSNWLRGSYFSFIKPWFLPRRSGDKSCHEIPVSWRDFAEHQFYYQSKVKHPQIIHSKDWLGKCEKCYILLTNWFPAAFFVLISYFYMGGGGTQEERHHEKLNKKDIQKIWI